MAARLYSETFLRPSNVGVYTTYTVPVGWRAVIRNVTVSTPSTAGADVYVSVAGTYVWVGRGLGANLQLAFATFVVAYGGQLIQSISFNQAASVSVSGHEFEDPSHATGPRGTLSYERAVQVKPVAA